MKIDNTLSCHHVSARDQRLSRKARGLLAELLTYEHDADITLDELVELGREAGGNAEKTFAIRAAMKELETSGYVVRERGRSAAGMWWTETYVYGCPHAGCGNRLGLDRGKPGHLKRLVDTSVKTSESPVSPVIIRDSGKPPDWELLDAWSEPGVVSRGGLSDAGNRILLEIGEGQPEEPKSKAAPTRGPEDPGVSSKADHVRKGADENWPTVARIPVPDLTWADKLYDRE